MKPRSWAGWAEPEDEAVLLPWVDEALFMLTKHPNFFAELSYYIATVTPEELFRFLVHAQQSFVPLEKLFFGTDNPGFLYDPVELRVKLLSVNDYAERVGAAPIRPGRDAARASAPRRRPGGRVSAPARHQSPDAARPPTGAMPAPPPGASRPARRRGRTARPTPERETEQSKSQRLP